MHRRSFVTTLAATGLVSGGFTAGPARSERSDAMQQGDSRQVRLRFGREFVFLRQVLIVDSVRAFALQWSGGAPFYDEDRVDLSGAPGLGTLFRTPFRTRWVEGQPLGEVTLNGDTLIARVNDAARYQGDQVTLGAGHFSWDLPGRLAPLSGMPQAGRAAGALRMGDDGRLLISLPNAEPAI